MRTRLSDSALKHRLQGLYGYEQVEVPERPVEERAACSDEVLLGYTPEAAHREALRCMQCQDPPCVEACPIHLNVPGYAKAIVEGDYKRGLQIVMDTYPLPGTCGRVCFHPCTDVCLKGIQGEPLNIPRLRRFLADNVSQYDLKYNIPPPSGRQIALVGSGPASLSCAYHLRRRGHRVVVYEKDKLAGGTLNILPGYRLPQQVLQDEVKVLEWLGIEIRTESPIAGDGCLDHLLEEYDAVFIAAGAIGSSKPKMPGVNLARSITGLDYLRAVRDDRAPEVDQVAIIGGGDVAMDSLRVALRRARVVHWIYRRSAEEMPAHEPEVLELGEEVTLRDLKAVEDAFSDPYRQNVLREARAKLLKLTFAERQRLHQEMARQLKHRLLDKLPQGNHELAQQQDRERRFVVHMLTNPTRVLGGERVSGLELVRMKLGEPDESGRRRPKPIEGSEFQLEVDLVIFAIGQNVESGWLGSGSEVEVDRWGQILIDPESQATGRQGVFAGGDAVRGPASMIDALADGKRAAESIERMFQRQTEVVPVAKHS